jgi:hypothetical protein
MNWKRELSIGGTLLAVGFVGLPLAIYGVGAQIIGEYAEGADYVDLMLAIWTALGEGRWAAWVLVLSPFMVISMLRATRRLWRAG